MHHRLSQILEQEVVGGVVLDGAATRDVALGRVTLPRLDPAAAGALADRLQAALGVEIQVKDRLHLGQSSRPVRGLLELLIPDQPPLGPYLLQVSSAPLWTFFHRRFLLEPGIPADLMGCYCDGLARLFRGGRERPLREICEYDELQQHYNEALDAAVQAGVNGAAADPEPWVSGLLDDLRRCWRLLPWPLRASLTPVSRPAARRRATHEAPGAGGRTVLLAADVLEGTLVSEYTHQHHDLEDYGQVLAWMHEVAAALEQTYPAPGHEVVLAQASSTERLLQSYPGLRGVLVAQ